MRARKRKNTDKRIDACKEYLIEYEAPFVFDFYELFKNENPVKAEIGCGKGLFITETAIRNPDMNFIGIEKEKEVLVLALEKAKALGLKNVLFINCDAKELQMLFGESSISTIYLNFSDPWPPKKRAKRRLTHKSYLEIYRKILTENGEIRLKTDNDGLFEFSINELSENGFEIIKLTYDLHAENDQSNIMTEYEKRFSEAGVKIKQLIAVKS